MKDIKLRQFIEGKYRIELSSIIGYHEHDEADFKHNNASTIRFIEEGTDRYRIFTPFVLEDGDHLSIVLKKEQEQWIFSDEGHTYMQLDDEIAKEGDVLKQLIDSNSFSNQIENRHGELIQVVEDEQYKDTLNSFTQALLKISSLR